MEGKSFRLRIIVIFIIPIVALVYSLYYFVDIKKKELHESKNFISYSESVKILNKIIHNVQLERGLSVGFIVAKSKESFIDGLRKQYHVTDLSFKEAMDILVSVSLDKDIASKPSSANRLKFKRVLEYYKKLEIVREFILDTSFSFDETIEYYSRINEELIDAMRSLTSYNYYGLGYSVDIYKIELLKEYAGLERAYIYNCLLSENCKKAQLASIQSLIRKQYLLLEDFEDIAKKSDLKLFKKYLSITVVKHVNKMREDFFSNNLGRDDAKKWFRVSTDRINAFGEFTIKVVDINHQFALGIYRNANNNLYTAFVLSFFAILAFLMLLYFLNRLIEQEAKIMSELRISAYAFDSHEAMSITDIDGTIIRVNKAFEEITGYKEEEAIGLNPNILKSNKHPDIFYQNMWQEILEKGFWKGELYNKRKNGEIYPERLSITAIKDKSGVTTHYIAHFLDISDIKKAHEQALYQARHDFLTSLPNRKYMMHKLSVELERSKKAYQVSAFLFIDIDDLKKVNDEYGHVVGDGLLKAIANRLEGETKTEDFLARFSGDEFCLIYNNTSGNKSLENVKDKCEKILQLLSTTFYIDEHRIKISGSIGVRLFPNQDDNISMIINDADMAMYKAKEMGKNRFVLLDERIEKEIKKRAAMEQEIKQAIHKKEFIFHYQPKVCVDSGAIEGAELMLRWIHSDGNVYEPKYFLHVIRDMNIISSITASALRTACLFLDNNRNVYDKTLSINVAACEFAMDDCVSKIQDIIHSYKINPSQIEFEIIEDELIEDFDRIIANMYALKEFGIKFAIDDFGQGYSSVTYLKKLPVDTLKLDKFFMQGLASIENRELVRMVIDIAKTFHMTIVIEGIEEDHQLEFIRECNADQYQGYYFSEAVGEKEFLELWKKHKA